MAPGRRLRSEAPRRFGCAPLARICFCVCILLLLGGAFASAQGQVISTIAGGFNPSAKPSESFCLPINAAAPHGTDIYVVSCNRILKVDAQGNQTVVAGNGMVGFSGDGGPATSASFDVVTSMSLDASGDIFIADTGNRVREVDAATGKIQTVAGNGMPGFSGDFGLATSARLNRPSSVFADNSGNIFIADTGNQRIREVMAAMGIITTVAGFSGARLVLPVGVFVDGSGNIFIADEATSLIWEVVKTGGMITVAGSPGARGFSGDGGPATSATLFDPSGVFGDSLGNIFIADTANRRIREVVGGPGGNIQTVAGNGADAPISCTTSLDACIGDGGPATSGIIGAPRAVFVDSSGNLYILAIGEIQEVVAGTGILQTFAGNGALGFGGDNGPASSAQFDYPADAVADSSGNIFIADVQAGRVREVVAATGIIKTVAGSGGTCAVRSEACIGNGGPATNAVIRPESLAVDALGNIFIADGFAGEIREIVASTGIIQSVAGSIALADHFSGDGGPATSASLAFPTGVFVDASGNIFIADENNLRIREVSGGIIRTVAGNGTSGFSGDGGLAINATFDYPISVFVDASGNIFIADLTDHRVREIVAATGIIQTVAGNGTAVISGDGGPATSAGFGAAGPISVFGDTHGNIFVADFLGNEIRKFTVGGNIQTIAGNRVEGFSGDGGPAANAELNGPNSVFVDSAARLLIADFSNVRVRMVALAGSGSQASSTTLSSSINPSVGGQSITFAAVVASSAGGTPEGSVNFLDSGTQIGTGVLSNGQTTFTTSSLAPGAHQITAQYSGDFTFAASNSAQLTETINIAAFGAGPATMPTVTAGQSVQIPLTVFAAPGSNLAFTMACSNLPANSSCNFNPNPFTPGPPPNGSQVQMTFVTQAPSAAARMGRLGMPGPGLLGIFSIAAALAGIGGLFASGKAQRRRLAWGTAMALLMLAAVIAGCSSGSHSSSGGASGGTPQGVANITVTATSGATRLAETISISVQ